MIIHYGIQQGSPEWHELRNGKVTGTTLTRVKSEKWLEYADKLASQRITGQYPDDDFTNDAMEDGNYYEPFLFEAYAELTMSELRSVGFIQPERFKHFGISPDRLIFNGSDAYGGVEGKCPTPAIHTKYIRQNKIPTIYRPQIISYFLCSETIKYVDFVSYCPDIPEYQLFVKRITRNEAAEEIADYNGKLVKFFEQVDEMESILRNGNGFRPSFTPPKPERVGGLVLDEDETDDEPTLTAQLHYELFHTLDDIL